jgi:hypothetical protein
MTRSQTFRARFDIFARNQEIEMLKPYYSVRIALLTMTWICVAACKSSTSDNGADAAAATTEKLTIGSPCTKDSDCGSAPFYCMVDHPGGYCMRDCTTDADCPSEAICQNDGMKGECHKKCNAPADCRAAYTCSPAASAADNKASHAFCDVMDSPDAATTHH